MKNSTVLVGVGTLALIGAGAYLYLKGKKSTTTNSTVTTPTTPTSTKALVDDNYILAKNIAGEIKALVDKLNNLSKTLFGTGAIDRRNLESQLQQKQNQLKTLSYKMTANFEVEKI